MSSSESPHTLPDGRTVLFRPIHADDTDRLLEFGRHLPPSAVRRRFFVARIDFDAADTRAYASHLCDVDGEHRMAFVVTLPGEDEILAVGRYEEEAPGTAEVAFTVAADLQGQGVARELLHRLADHARDRGFTHFSALTLAENAPMIAVFRHSGFPCELHLDRDTETVLMDITRPPLPRATT